MTISSKNCLQIDHCVVINISENRYVRFLAHKYLISYKLIPGFISDVVVTSNGKYFVTSESEQILFWNMPSRVVLFKDIQPNIIQLILLVRHILNFCLGLKLHGLLLGVDRTN